MMSMLCNCCVRELLILARTWFAFGLPSKTGCDTEVVMVNFNVSPPSGVLSATTFLQEFLVFSSAFRASSMMTSLPLPLLAALGQIRTFCRQS
jgi:hypothetical protein